MARWALVATLAAPTASALAVVAAPVATPPFQLPVEERAESLYAEAEAAWAAGDAAGALRSFARLPEEFPAARYPALTWRAAGRVRAGEIHLRLGESLAAAASFVEVLEGEPVTSWTSRARLGLGITLLREDDWRAGTHLLQGVVAAAERGGPDAEPAAAELAGRLLSLAHRLWLRPAGGEQPWRDAGRLPIGATLDDPIGVAVDEHDTLLVTDEGLNAVLLVDPAGNAATIPQREVRRPWWSPDGIGFAAAKDTIVAPQSGETYRFVWSEGSRMREVRDLRAGTSDGLGGWVLADGGARRVMLFDAAGEYLRSLDLGANGDPVDVARGVGGQLYVLDRRSRAVVLFGVDGAPQGRFSLEGWREPYALDVDLVGHVYVLDRGDNRVHVFDRFGELLWSLGPRLPGGVELRDPRDIAVDAWGRILIADRGLAVVVVVQ